MIRFSLRKLFILISIFAIAIACFGYRFNRARQQHFAVRDLPGLDLDVFYDYEHDGWMDVGLDIPEHVDESPYPTLLVDWLGIDFFATINDVQMEASFEIPFEKLQPVFDLGTIEQFASTGASLESVEKFALLKRLKRLLLTEAPIADISPLSGLSDLISLNLRGTLVEDVSALKSLKKLEWLSLEDTKVEDISAIANLRKLKSLDLSSSSVTDVSSLCELTDLEELNLFDTGVTDLTPLSELTNLTDLRFSNHSEQSIVDISFLHNMSNLTSLSMFDVRCTDVSPIANCEHLTRLTIFSETISDIEALREFSALKSLSLYMPELSDISAIAGHTDLTDLDIGQSQVDDLAPLAGLRKLKSLVICAPAKNIDCIAELSELCELKVSDCPIDNLPLANLVNLNQLTIENSIISRMPESRSLASLQGLAVNNTQICDFKVLSKLPQIIRVEITNPKVPDVILPSLSDNVSLEAFRLINAHVKHFGTLPAQRVFTFDLTGSTFESFDFLSTGNFYQLDLSHTNFSDLSVLVSAKIDGTLKLSHTQVTDLSPLINCKLELYTINLDETKVVDFTPLASLEKLRWVHVSQGTPRTAIDAAKKLNPQLEFYFVEDGDEF